MIAEKTAISYYPAPSLAKIKVRVCDDCEAEDVLYRLGDGEYCADCVLDHLEKVREDA